MATVLGIDWAADFTADLADDLQDVSFTRTTLGAFDADNPTAAPSASSATYDARGLAFAYEEQNVDGEHITRGDYAVMILLGTIELASVAAPGIIPQIGDTVTAPPPGQATPLTGTVVNIDAVTQASVTVRVRGPAL